MWGQSEIVGRIISEISYRSFITGISFIVDLTRKHIADTHRLLDSRCSSITSDYLIFPFPAKFTTKLSIRRFSLLIDRCLNRQKLHEHVSNNWTTNRDKSSTGLIIDFANHRRGERILILGLDEVSRVSRGRKRRFRNLR